MDRLQVRVLKTGDEKALEAFLLPRVDSSMFLLSNLRAAGLDDHGQRFGGVYVAAFEGGAMVAVLAHYSLHGNLILQAPAHIQAMLWILPRDRGIPLHGLIGPGEQVESAANHLEFPHEGPRVQVNSREILYALPLEKLHVPAALAHGGVTGRRATPSDTPLMVQWRVAYCMEALHSKESQALATKCQADIEAVTRLGHLWVLEAEGRPVASSAFNAAIAGAVQVGGVWTPPEFRGHGYGRCVVAASLRDAKAEGVERAVLFTGEDNTAATRSYASLGFAQVGDYRMLLLH